MKTTTDVLRAEKAFFDALVGSQADELERLLARDFSLADLSGGLLSKAALVDAVRSGMLRFENIDLVESSVRLYGTTAVVTGRTRLRGRLEGNPFAAHSRYTHVYVEQEGNLHLAAAQGTPIPE